MATDAEIQQWVLDSRVCCEMDRYDYNDAVRGKISKRARARFEGQYRATPPQVRFVPFDNTATANGYR